MSMKTRLFRNKRCCRPRLHASRAVFESQVSQSSLLLDSGKHLPQLQRSQSLSFLAFTRTKNLRKPKQLVNRNGRAISMSTNCSEIAIPSGRSEHATDSAWHC